MNNQLEQLISDRLNSVLETSRQSCHRIEAPPLPITQQPTSTPSRLGVGSQYPIASNDTQHLLSPIGGGRQDTVDGNDSCDDMAEGGQNRSDFYEKLLGVLNESQNMSAVDRVQSVGVDRSSNDSEVLSTPTRRRSNRKKVNTSLADSLDDSVHLSPHSKSFLKQVEDTLKN